MNLANGLKTLICVFALFATPIYAQEEIIIESWRNSGRWFTANSYQQEDLKFWLGGAAAITVAFNFDLGIHSGLQIKNDNRRAILSKGFEPFGNPIYMGSAGVLCYLGGHIRKNEELKSVSSAALQSMLTTGVSILALKLVFHRVRPEEQLFLDPYVFKGPSLKRNNLSFPSGHSAIAFSTAASISEYYDNKWYIAVPLYSIASLTAWQRVFDQKHWPSDVLTGALIGIFIGRKIAKWQKENLMKISFQSIPGAAGGITMRLPLD